MTVNKKQLAICKQRGHDAYLSGGQWSQCKYCHLWLREVRTIEESETEPPEEDQSELHKLKALRQEVERQVKRKKKG